MLSAHISSSPRPPLQISPPSPPLTPGGSSTLSWGSASLSGSKKGGGPAQMGGGRHQEASMEQLQPVGEQSGGPSEKEGQSRDHAQPSCRTEPGLRRHSSSSSSSSRGGRFRLKKPTWGCTGPGQGQVIKMILGPQSSTGRSNYARNRPAMRASPGPAQNMDPTVCTEMKAFPHLGITHATISKYVLLFLP